MSEMREKESIECEKTQKLKSFQGPRRVVDPSRR